MYHVTSWKYRGSGRYLGNTNTKFNQETILFILYDSSASPLILLLSKFVFSWRPALNLTVGKLQWECPTLGEKAAFKAGVLSGSLGRRLTAGCPQLPWKRPWHCRVSPRTRPRYFLFLWNDQTLVSTDYIESESSGGLCTSPAACRGAPSTWTKSAI